MQESGIKRKCALSYVYQWGGRCRLPGHHLLFSPEDNLATSDRCKPSFFFGLVTVQYKKLLQYSPIGYERCLLICGEFPAFLFLFSFSQSDDMQNGQCCNSHNFPLYLWQVYAQISKT